MNPYKLQAILRHVRSRGSLPTDQFGNVLSPDELIAWFELDACLNPAEQAVVRNELSLMAEAQAIADRLDTTTT